MESHKLRVESSKLKGKRKNRTLGVLVFPFSLSLSGRYAEMGRQAAAALNLFAADQNAGGGIELGGRDARDEDHMVTETPVRGFYKYYREVMDL